MMPLVRAALLHEPNFEVVYDLVLSGEYTQDEKDAMKPRWLHQVRLHAELDGGSGRGAHVPSGPEQRSRLLLRLGAG